MMQPQQSSIFRQKRSNHIQFPPQKRMRCQYQFTPFSAPYSVHHHQTITDISRVRTPSELVPHQQPFKTPMSNNLQQSVNSDFSLITSLSVGLNSLATQQKRGSCTYALGEITSVSPTNQQTPMEDSMGLDFDPDKLKVHHGFAVRPLYADLPRQCKTCGMRFKTQDQHSDHMDWHVRKNRAAKKSSSKQRVSRYFFPNSSLWLKAAEADANPPGPAFFPTDKVEKVKNYEELYAVPADEDQKDCPLCMERFDEYFSNEENDWIYRGAAYVSEPKASTRKLYKSLLGRIVHAKCIYS